MDIRMKLRKVPSSHGIYIMKGAKERVIYVGKAKNLRNRLRSYFQQSASLDARKSMMIREVRDFEYVVTKNELEALVLESNFIKRTRPRYNIFLRDDKHYPYLKLTVNEEWPRLEVVRKIKKDGAEYFGPYVPAGGMREMLRFIRRNFPLRTCGHSLDQPFRPCIQFQIDRCLAPCSKSLRTGRDREKYLDVVHDVQAFIRGEKRELLAALHERMKRFSYGLQYEEAAKIRDRLAAIEKAWESQRVISPELGDLDVVGLYREGHEACVFILFIRNGTVIGQRDFFFKNIAGMEDTELVAGFIEQFYSKEMLLPPKIITPLREKFTTQRQWLGRKRGKPVRIAPAGSELENRVWKMADENAFFSFSKHKNIRADETLLEIKNLLGLKKVPNRIGAVDISNISGSEAVGALIVYEDGHFRKEDYRLFRIKTVEGINDFAMTGEVVGRHLKNLSADSDGLPELLLIDGGRGQLDAALNALKPFALPVEVAAIAKAKSRTVSKASGVRRDVDRIYLPDKKAPVPLEPLLASTRLLQKIRDEVHRFAVGYHRKLRTSRTLSSPLEKIRGIGKTRRLLLLKHFGSIDAIRQASIDEIAGVKGMNRTVAEELKKSLEQLPSFRESEPVLVRSVKGGDRGTREKIKE